MVKQLVDRGSSNWCSFAQPSKPNQTEEVRREAYQREGSPSSSPPNWPRARPKRPGHWGRLDKSITRPCVGVQNARVRPRACAVLRIACPASLLTSSASPSATSGRPREVFSTNCLGKRWKAHIRRRSIEPVLSTGYQILVSELGVLLIRFRAALSAVLVP